MTASDTVQVRLFAAAKAAVGAAERSASGSTIAEALADLAAGAADPAAARRVFARSSFLVDGVATTDPATPLSGAATIDILPPFAGG